MATKSVIKVKSKLWQIYNQHLNAWREHFNFGHECLNIPGEMFEHPIECLNPPFRVSNISYKIWILTQFSSISPQHMPRIYILLISKALRTSNAYIFRITLLLKQFKVSSELVRSRIGMYKSKEKFIRKTYKYIRITFFFLWTKYLATLE